MGHSQPIRGRTHAAAPRVAASGIPDKLYFRIGEVARLCDVPAYVLRFWESEFPQLKPNKGGSGQRLYRRRDVEMALRVKVLLKEEGYTIPGARQMLKSELKRQSPQLSLLASDAADPKQLRNLRRELQAIAAMLARPIGDTPQKTQPKPANDGKAVARGRPSVRDRSAPIVAPAAREAARTAPVKLLFDTSAPSSKSEGDGR